MIHHSVTDWVSFSIQAVQVVLQNSWSMPVVPGTEVYLFVCFCFFKKNVSKCGNPALNLTIQHLHTSVMDDLMSGAIYRTQGYNPNLRTIKEVPLC